MLDGSFNIIFDWLGVPSDFDFVIYKNACMLLFDFKFLDFYFYSDSDVLDYYFSNTLHSPICNDTFWQIDILPDQHLGNILFRKEPMQLAITASRDFLFDFS